jgi:hypothetical protein
MNLLNTNLEKMVDLVLYDFLTTGISVEHTKFSPVDGVYSFLSNQKKIQAVFYNKQLIIPTLYHNHNQNHKPRYQNLKQTSIIPDISWIPIKLGLVLSRIKPKSIYTKDSLLIISTCLYHTDFDIIFDLDLVNLI